MRSNTNGFTMIELMLSMGFVAFLMVTIALTTISMSRTYERGLTLTQVNTAGRAIISDMQTTIQQSSSAAVGHRNLPLNASDTTLTGRIYCFGQYSYVYNTGSAISAGTSSSLVKYSGGASNGMVVRLARVTDPGGALCKGPAPTSVGSGTATELLPAGDRDLAVQQNGNANGGLLVSNLLQPTDPRILTPPSASLGLSGLQSLFQIDFTIGTNDQQAINTTNFSCKPPSGAGSDLNYCAINHFSFIVRTSGGSSS